jgi:hypothetical protein
MLQPTISLDASSENLSPECDFTPICYTENDHTSQE